MKKSLAFSLVELSIVLVILGLLVGGILAGQSLIRAAELRAVVTESQRYQAAVNAFRDKYFALPGDMTRATSIWGDNNTACADAAITNGTPGTCNGNGDGFVTQSNGSPNATSESLQMWLQMSLAGLIEGNYAGTWDTSGSAAFGTQWPKSKLANAGWRNNAASNYSGDTITYAADYGNYIEISALGSARAVLKPEEGWNIDTKLDDGKPGTGTIIARYWDAACANATANNDYTGSYRLSDTAIQCSLIFRKLL